MRESVFAHRLTLLCRALKSLCSLKLKITVIVSLISSAGAFKDTIVFITSLYPLPTFFFTLWTIPSFSRLLLCSVRLHLLLDCLDDQRVPLICSHRCHRSSMKACGPMNAYKCAKITVWIIINVWMFAVSSFSIKWKKIWTPHSIITQLHGVEQNDLWGDFYVRQMQVCCVLSTLPWITFPFIVSV